VIALAAPGRIMGFDVDTAHFTGNYPPACRIEACRVQGEPDDGTAWQEILPMQPLGPSAHHFFACADEGVWSHLRLHIYPDGGVARLRVYGRPVLAGDPGGEIDLASALNGARVVAFSNAHYGAYQRLLAPGRGRDMGDGWETRRLREPGNDWLIVELGARGRIARAGIDTCHYKGNFPESASLQAADLSDFKGDVDQAVVTSAMFWPALLERQTMTADAIHEFGAELADIGPVTHVRLNIFPDGGVSRLRLFGQVA
jgi:allantoicase